jgi:hypothetical protein
MKDQATIKKNLLIILIILFIMIIFCSSPLLLDRVLSQHPIYGYTVYACLAWGNRFSADGKNEILLNWIVPFRGNVHESIPFLSLINWDSICGYSPWLPFFPTSGSFQHPY